MADHSSMRLGKAPARHDLRRMARATVAISKLPPAPEAVDWTDGIATWGMMLNDRLGDCTIAGVAHAIQIATYADHWRSHPPLIALCWVLMRTGQVMIPPTPPQIKGR